MIYNQFKSPIHVDFAGEYISNTHRRYLADQGTLLQFSCPGAHAQNGVAKCKHRHILETALALLIFVDLAPHFWAEAISMTVFLINRHPSSALKGSTPYQHFSVLLLPMTIFVALVCLLHSSSTL